MISLSGGPDVGYGGDCGTLEPPTVTKSGWWRTLPALWRHAGDVDAAPKSGPGVNDNDRLTGGKGDDALFGGPGADRLVGGSGADYLSGGSGHDRLVGGPGRNRIEAGGGSDSINSANGVREHGRLRLRSTMASRPIAATSSPGASASGACAARARRT